MNQNVEIHAAVRLYTGRVPGCSSGSRHINTSFFADQRKTAEPPVKQSKRRRGRRQSKALGLVYVMQQTRSLLPYWAAEKFKRHAKSLLNRTTGQFPYVPEAL